MTTKTSTKPKNRNFPGKRLFIAVGLALVLAAASAGWFMMRPKKPDPNTQSIQEVLDYARSEKFQQSDPQQRRDYMRQAFMGQATQRANTYMQLPEEQRLAYLDQTIDEMVGIRQQMRQFRSQSPGSGDPNTFQRQSRNRRPDPAQMRVLREQIPANDKRNMTVFFTALRMRMQQRGVDMRPPAREAR